MGLGVGHLPVSIGGAGHGSTCGRIKVWVSEGYYVEVILVAYLVASSLNYFFSKF